MTGRQMTLSDIVRNHDADCGHIDLYSRIDSAYTRALLARLDKNLRAIGQICNIDDWDWNQECTGPQTARPQTHAARAQAVRETRNELEKKILDHIRPLDLTSAELCWMLSEMAYRWADLAYKDEREHRCE